MGFSEWFRRKLGAAFGGDVEPAFERVAGVGVEGCEQCIELIAQAGDGIGDEDDIQEDDVANHAGVD
jgi:hypothetical protein